jgi:predicted acyltransferase (DUF342 family)
MPSRGSVRSAREVEMLGLARHEKISLVLGRAVEKIIRSRRALVATRRRLAADRRNFR